MFDKLLARCESVGHPLVSSSWNGDATRLVRRRLRRQQKRQPAIAARRRTPRTVQTIIISVRALSLSPPDEAAAAVAEVAEGAALVDEGTAKEDEDDVVVGVGCAAAAVLA